MGVRRNRQTKAAGCVSATHPSPSAGSAPILPILGIVVGICLLAAPIVLDLRETWVNSQAVSVMSDTVDLSQDPDHTYYLQQARAYNAVLAGEEPEIDAGDILPYEQQLGSDREPVVSWVEIPSISVRLPVYLGTSEAVLSAGVGHVEWSSLPVGGASTHSVLTGHSGMYDSRMFDDIRNLQAGDLFAVHTLGDTYVYEVSDIRTVWPEETESLGVVPGEDLCTLVTCTPYGVNDHRLLVTGTRTSRQLESNTLAQDAVNYATNPRVLPLIAGLAIVALGLALYVWRRRAKTNEDDRAKRKR